MDKLPVAITDLSQVPIGQRIEDAVRRFPTDRLYRLDILRHVLSFEREPMTFIAAVKETVGQDSFSDFISVYGREHTIMLYDVLVDARRRMKGVVLPAETNLAEGLLQCRLEWRLSPDTQRALRRLLALIRRSIFWFNVQLMAIWVQHLDPNMYRTFPLTRDLSPMPTMWQLGPQCVLVGNFAYSKATSGSSPYIGKAYHELVEAAAGFGWLIRVFTITPEEAHQWTQARIRGYVMPEEPTPSVVVESKLPVEVVDSTEELGGSLQGSIWIPGKR